MKDSRPERKIRMRFISMSVLVTALTLIILQGLNYLHLERIISLPDYVVRIINSVSLVIAVFFIISLVLRLTINRMNRLFDEPEERIFYSKIYTWTLYTVGVFYILHRFGVSLGNITLFIGLIATGLAFAVRDVLLSFFGWMILLRKKPFRIGDYIKIGEDEGKVMHIGTFHVLLDSTHELPEDYTRVPNRFFLEKSVTILGKNNFLDQISFLLATMPEQKNALLQSLAEDVHAILQNDAYLSVYMDMRNDKLLLIVEYLIEIHRKQAVRSAIIDACFQRFGDHITLPKV